MAVQDHDSAAGPQVPDSSDAVEAAAGEEGAVGVECDGEDLSGVAFLEEEFAGCLDVPETPGCVEGGRGKVLA